MARSGDVVVGKVGFNWAALSQRADITTRDEPWLDSGIVLPMYLRPHPSEEEWAYREVQFNQPFGETPVVLVTGFNLPDLYPIASNRPAVFAASIGVVFNATRFGFTLGARNVDDRDGQTGFFWVALGCTQGCGAGPSLP